MRLKNTAFAYNVTVQGSSNCDWGTDIGQSKKHTFTLEGFPEVANAMLYYKISDVENIKVILGKGNRTPKPFSEYSDELVLASCFTKVFWNEIPLIGQKFIMFIIKEKKEFTTSGDKNPHFNRCTLKFSNSIIYNDQKVNQDCIDCISDTLGQPHTGSWAVLDMTIENEDELHFWGFGLGDFPKDYPSKEARNEDFVSRCSEVEKSILKHTSRGINKSKESDSQQQIYYGAPGTGKSFTIDSLIDENNSVRTTFHPDSDYSSFVGCYKPVAIPESCESTNVNSVLLNKQELINKIKEIKDSEPYSPHKICTKYWNSFDQLSSHEQVEILSECGFGKSFLTELNKGRSVGEYLSRFSKNTKSEITYDFVPQAFTTAYVEAWKDLSKPYYLVIEEINRGNCAQIFGDIFQLLDRGDDGFSSYGIKPDTDLQQYLKNVFSDVNIEDTKIKSGEMMKLPANLRILATMNTSDQSLFPIDSAFKRRWDWKYIPITKGDEEHYISANEKMFSWSKFMTIVNERIEDVTSSEDKQIGYWFAKPDDENKISADKFVGKVIFYLWNDVFKDYMHSSDNLFNVKSKKAEDNGSHLYKFREFFKADGSIDEVVLDKFLTAIGLVDKNALNADDAEAEVEENAE